MAVLHLEDVPDELYRRIEQLAAAEQVPLTEETLRLLRRAIGTHAATAREDVNALLDEMRRSRVAPGPGTSDSVDLLREDRAR